jgi:hypothetical protein
MDKPDYYAILQVHPSAVPEIIQAAYKRLALIHHPDRDPSPDAVRRMALINEAYEVLSDPSRRRAYDAARDAGRQRPSPGEAEQPARSRGKKSRRDEYRQGRAPGGRGEWVEVSARTIVWPNVCACCCRPADTEVEVSSTRTKGTQVVRTQTRTWEVPYCRGCLDHIEAARELSSLRQTDDGNAGRAVGCCLLLAVGLVVAVIWLCAGLPLFVAILLDAIALVVIGLATILALGGLAQNGESRAAEQRRRREETESRFGRASCEGCAEGDRVAVAYDGWDGPRHRFYFSNHLYAERFLGANPRSCRV